MSKFTDAKKALSAIGVTLRRDPFAEEFVVNLKGGKEATASYTNDLEDALGTGKAMAAHRDAKKEKSNAR